MNWQHCQTFTATVFCGLQEGYQFPGIVRSVFTTGGGEPRYVVEHTESPGLLHIFSGQQLQLVARQACGWCSGTGYIQGKDSNDVERCWKCVGGSQ